MNDLNRLAIVIPLYKKDFFEETLNSICNQTDKRFNLYIGNDASSSDFEEIIKSYKEKFDFTYQFFKNNLGGEGRLVEQWERCIALSNNEEYIQILGDDDFISSNFVETFYQILDDKKTFDLLRFKMLKVSSESEVLQEFNQIENINSTQHLLNDLNQVYWISISENIFSRRVYNNIGIKKYPLAWRSDAMLVFEFGLHSIEVTNESYVAIRRSNVQLTMDVTPKILELKRKAMSFFYNDLLENYEIRFSKEERSEFSKKILYYTEKLGINQKKILKRNLGLYNLIKFYLHK